MEHVFARYGRAGCAKRDFFSWISFFCQDGSNEVSRAPGRGRQVRFVPDGRTDPDGMNGHYAVRYIDTNM